MPGRAGFVPGVAADSPGDAEGGIVGSPRTDEQQRAAISAWDWQPESPWRCPRCGQLLLTREAAPTCPTCLYREGTS